MLAVGAQIAQLRGAAAGEREQRHGHRHGHVDAHLAHVDLFLELARCAARLGKDGRAVAVGVGVDELDGLIQRGRLDHAQHGAKNFLVVHAHARFHAAEDGRADKVALFVAGHGGLAAIQHQLGTIGNAALNQALNAAQSTARNHRAHIGARLIAAADFQRFGFGDQVGQPLLRLAHQHHHRQGHAALARCAKGGTGNGVQGLLFIGIGQHDGVVFCAHHALHALAVQAGAVVHMRAHVGRAHKADRLDVFVVANGVYRILAAVNHVQHPGRNPGLQCQLAQAHGHHRVLLRRLEHKGIARGNRHGEHPQRNHRREVKRRNPRAHAQRLQQRVGIDTTGHVVGQLAQLQIANGAGVLHHLQATEHVALCVGQGFALFSRQQRGQLAHVFANQLLQLQKNAGAGTNGGFLPRLERFLGRSHRGVDLVLRSKRHAGQHFLRSGVHHITPLGGFGFNKFAVDK